METTNRSFKGVWIPRETWEDKRLSAFDKVLLAEINSLDSGEGCHASNEYLASFMQVSPSHLANSITKLRKLGLVQTVAFNGKRRFLKLVSQPYEIQEGSLTKNSNPVLICNNKEDNSATAEAVAVPASEKADDLDDVRKVYDAFCTGFGKNPNAYKLSPNRIALIRRRLKDAGVEMTVAAVTAVSKSAFHRGENDRKWTADLDFILRSYEQVEKWGNVRRTGSARSEALKKLEAERQAKRAREQR